MNYDHWKTTEPESFNDRRKFELDGMSSEQLTNLVREQDAHIAKLERLNNEERATIEELSRSMRRVADMLEIARDELRQPADGE